MREVPSTPWLWSPSSPDVLGRGRQHPQRWSGAGGRSRRRRAEKAAGRAAARGEGNGGCVCKGLLLAARTQLIMPRACIHSKPFTCTSCPLPLGTQRGIYWSSRLCPWPVAAGFGTGMCPSCSPVIRGRRFAFAFQHPPRAGSNASSGSRKVGAGAARQWKFELSCSHPLPSPLHPLFSVCDSTTTVPGPAVGMLSPGPR